VSGQFVERQIVEDKSWKTNREKAFRGTDKYGNGQIRKRQIVKKSVKICENFHCSIWHKIIYSRAILSKNSPEGPLTMKKYVWIIKNRTEWLLRSKIYLIWNIEFLVMKDRPEGPLRSEDLLIWKIEVWIVKNRPEGPLRSKGLLIWKIEVWKMKNRPEGPLRSKGL
jgi:hypothetical protein